MTRFAHVSIFALVIWAVLCTAGTDASIVTYEFGTGTSVGSLATTADPNLAASAFADGDGTTSYSTTVGNPVPSVEKSYSEITLATGSYLASNGYYEFSLTANTGYELNLTGLSFDYDKNQLTGGGAKPAITFDLRSSLDGYASTLGAVVDPGNAATGTFQTSIMNLSDITESVTFRIYLAKGNANFASAGLVHIDNVAVDGSVDALAANPEPTTLAIWGGLGLLGLLVARWKKKGLS